MTTHKRLTKETKILLSIFGPIAALFLVLAFFQYKAFSTNKARMEEQLYRQQELITTLAASRLENYIKEIMSRLDELGSAISGADTPSAMSESISRAFDSLQDRVDGIAYFDSGGRKVHSVSRRGVMLSLPAEGRFDEFFAVPKYAMSPYISPLTKVKDGGEVVYISCPIRKAGSGEFNGVVLVQVNRATFEGLCDKLYELDRQISFCYYDHQAQRICNSTRCDQGFGPGQKELMGGAVTSEMVEGDKARPGAARAGATCGRFRLLYYPVHLGGYRWYISSSMPMTIMDRMARGDLLMYGVPGVFFIFSLIGGGFYFTRVYRAKFKAESEALFQASLAEQGKTLAAEKDKLLAVLNSIPDGIMLLDGEGRVMDSNAKIKDILGVSPKGRLAEDLENMPEEFPIKALLGPIEGGDEKTIGNKTYKLVSIPVMEQGKGTQFEVRLLRDITLEKSLAQKKSDLVSMITHDVKSPLTAIIGISQWIRAEDGANPLGGETKEGIEAITRAANRILALMDNFLFLSSIEGARKLNKQPVDLNAFLGKAILEFHLQARQKGIKLDHHIADPSPVVYMDEHQMMRAVENLLSNALKYTLTGGQVSVSAKNFRNYVTITVSDTGSGINKKDIPYIFDRYYRSEIARKGAKGSGLGLAIAKAVVESHGGTIDVVTEEGSGTSFTLRLPINNNNHTENS